jgi:adenosylcobyric acid synthase
LLTLSISHEKRTAPNSSICGYQIHVGRSIRQQDTSGFALLSDGEVEGCVSLDNQVAGSYLHGMFDTPRALQQIIAWAGAHTDTVGTYASQQERN